MLDHSEFLDKFSFSSYFYPYPFTPVHYQCNTVICVLITHTWYLWVCKEESQIDDARDILEEETAHDLIAKYILGPYQLQFL